MILFNLINDGWIPVTSEEWFNVRLLGIRDLLIGSSEYLGLQGQTPLETAAIYRLLIAFVHAAYLAGESSQDLSDADNWRRVWQQKHLEQDIVNAYCDNWQPLFNLFDPIHPFYQDPRITGMAESVSSLMGHLASGNDATLFNHNTKSNSIRLRPDEAARSLVTIQTFGLCGTKGKNATFTDAPCARGVVFFVEGNTLFETLMLNLFDYDLCSSRLKRRQNDHPAWEQEDPFSSDPLRPYGLLDHLTWQNRRIRLIMPDGDNRLVDDMIYAPGLKCNDQKNKTVRDVFNPLLHWRAKLEEEGPSEQSDRSHFPIAFKPDRALWRDSVVLFELPSDDDGRDKPPAALTHIRELAAAGIVPVQQTYRLLAIGACTQPGQDKTFFYRAETLPLSVDLLREDKPCVGFLSEALDLAEKTGKLLKRCAFLLAWLISKPDTPDTEFDEPDKSLDQQTKIDYKLALGSNAKGRENQDRREARQAYQLYCSFGLERIYWSSLETHFYRFMQDLPGNPDSAKATWYDQLRRTAWAAFNQTKEYAGADLRSKRAGVKAEEQFMRGLGWLFQVSPSTTTGDETNATN